MMQIHRIAILAPLAVGLVAVICTIMIHAFPLSATVDFVLRERKLGRAGTNFWIDIGIVVLAILCGLAAHLMEIALWAVLYLSGEFADFGTAYYHSAVNYFGVSTAMIFAVIQRLVESCSGTRRVPSRA